VAASFDSAWSEEVRDGAWSLVSERRAALEAAGQREGVVNEGAGGADDIPF
jgi:hypothetical protein